MSDEIVLHQRFTMHARLQGGSLYTYSILHGDKVIGAWSRRSQRTRAKSGTLERPKTIVTLTYLLGSGPDAQEFRTSEELKTAYKAQLEQQQRDAEWDAAAKPKEERS